MKHVYGHGQNEGNECADHAAALGALGFTSNQNMNTRWVRPSFGTSTLFDACVTWMFFFFKKIFLRDVRRTHTHLYHGCKSEGSDVSRALSP